MRHIVLSHVNCPTMYINMRENTWNPSLLSVLWPILPISARKDLNVNLIWNQQCSSSLPRTQASAEVVCSKDETRKYMENWKLC